MDAYINALLAGHYCREAICGHHDRRARLCLMLVTLIYAGKAVAHALLH